MIRQQPIRLGFVPAKRGSFQRSAGRGHAAADDRGTTALGVEVVVPAPEETAYGCVENRQEAERCAELFRQQRGAGDRGRGGEFRRRAGGGLDRAAGEAATCRC